MAIFLVVVLLVFASLVARYHRNLYAPQDFKDQKYFFHGLPFPEKLMVDGIGIATSDNRGTDADQETVPAIQKSYSTLVSFGFVLRHQAEVVHPRTSPKSGRYRVRIWIEAIERRRHLSDIESVTYHVWSDFKQPVISTSNQYSDFDLWLSIYGEFPVLALVKTKDGRTYGLQRFIDLPSRPPDSLQ